VVAAAAVVDAEAVVAVPAEAAVLLEVAVLLAVAVALDRAVVRGRAAADTVAPIEAVVVLRGRHRSPGRRCHRMLAAGRVAEALLVEIAWQIPGRRWELCPRQAIDRARLVVAPVAAMSPIGRTSALGRAPVREQSPETDQTRAHVHRLGM
jgi:hypothetical protein